LENWKPKQALREIQQHVCAPNPENDQKEWKPTEATVTEKEGKNKPKTRYKIHEQRYEKVQCFE
jgi:hypothetical protein